MSLESKIISFIKKNFSDKHEANDLFELPEESDVLDKVQKWKSLPYESLEVMLEPTAKENTQNIRWDYITKTLFEEIMVKYSPGFGLEDNTEEYDKQWFSKFKTTEGYEKYYSERFSDLYKEKLGPQVNYTLKQDTESILNLCGSPYRENIKHIRGLVFGFVQSGKTLNYASVANAAMGTGFDMIIVLAGATNILREQTQNRLNHDLIGKGLVGVIAKKKPISLTSTDSDFNKKIANAQLNGVTLENTKVPVIAVVKKNVTPLKNLKKWLESQAGKGGVLKKAVLLIDDESDYASVNTKIEEDPTAINRGIRDILNSFDVSTYLAVTATPFANILIDHRGTNEDYGSDLFPKSFIWALDKPSSYVGVRETLFQSFVDVYSLDVFSDYEALEEELKFVFTAKKDDKFCELPIYAKHAICRFLFDATCLREEKPEMDHLSMLFNVSRFTDRHIELSSLINEFIEELYKIIRNSSMNKVSDDWLLLIREMAENNIEPFNSILDFWNELEKTIAITSIYDIHQKTKIPLTYKKNVKRNSILVGGISLSRGYTIEGLITSVFLRTTKTFDTLMQMGRWFGHKKNILTYLSVYTTPTIQNRFELIEESVIDLLKQIEEMKQLGQSPKDFGLNIRRHPNVVIEEAVRDMKSRQGLNVLSRAKSKSAQKITLKLSLDARNMETVRFLNNKEATIWNNELVLSFIDNMHQSKNCINYNPSTYPGLFVDQTKDNLLGFLDVPNDIINNFISKYNLPNQKISNTSAKLPLRFILEFLSKPENKLLKWDVSLVTGVSKEVVCINGKTYKKVVRGLEETIDGINLKIPKNQLSIPQHEYRFLNGDYKNKKDRITAREKRKIQKKNPLLLIFPIKPKENDKLNLKIFEDQNLWGWSISMPGSDNDIDYISVLANSVFTEELINEYSEELRDENN